MKTTCEQATELLAAEARRLLETEIEIINGRTYVPRGDALAAIEAALSHQDRLRQALDDIASERQRQIEVEGWSAEHDDEHSDRSLAKAAGCYVLHDAVCLPMSRRLTTQELIPELWPWDYSHWKPTSYRRNLVKAAALIVAEIERLDRQALQDQGNG